MKKLECIIRLVVFDHASAVERHRGGIRDAEEDTGAHRVASAFAFAAVGPANRLIAADRRAGEGHGRACEGEWVGRARVESHSQAAPDSIGAGNGRAAGSASRQVVIERTIHDVGRQAALETKTSTRGGTRGAAQAGVSPGHLIPHEGAVADVEGS